LQATYTSTDTILAILLIKNNGCCPHFPLFKIGMTTDVKIIPTGIGRE